MSVKYQGAEFRFELSGEWTAAVEFGSPVRVSCGGTISSLPPAWKVSVFDADGNRLHTAHGSCEVSATSKISPSLTLRKTHKPCVTHAKKLLQRTLKDVPQ